jgi:hypothetical protein
MTVILYNERWEVIDLAAFKQGDQVRVSDDGSTGTVEDPSYVYGGVLVMPDNPARPWAPLTPYLPFELELIPEHGGIR